MAGRRGRGRPAKSSKRSKNTKKEPRPDEASTPNQSPFGLPPGMIRTVPSPSIPNTVHLQNQQKEVDSQQAKTGLVQPKVQDPAQVEVLRKLEAEARRLENIRAKQRRICFKRRWNPEKYPSDTITHTLASLRAGTNKARESTSADKSKPSSSSGGTQDQKSVTESAAYPNVSVPEQVETDERPSIEPRHFYLKRTNRSSDEEETYELVEMPKRPPSKKSKK